VASDAALKSTMAKKQFGVRDNFTARWIKSPAYLSILKSKTGSQKQLCPFPHHEVRQLPSRHGKR
jgi:hypothetical protein